MGSAQKCQKSEESFPLKVSWLVDLKLTHLDWSPEATLIHFQGHYQDVCELEYSILQGELLNLPKIKADLNIGDICLVEDLSSGRWHRGRVQGRKGDLLDVFLIDHGNNLSVDASRVSSCPEHLQRLPPKIVCGFLANVLLFSGCSCSAMQDYFSTLLKTNVKGHIKALLPHKVLLLEVPDVNSDIVLNGLGRYVDTNTFLLLVEMLTEIPLKHSGDPVSGLQGDVPDLSFCGPRLGSGARVDVRVTAAFHPGLFYCRETSRDGEFWELSKKLAAACEDRNKAGRRETVENLGSLCAVKHKDGKWYRSFVQLVALNTEVRAWFIDCGFFESVEVEDLQSLPPSLYSTPLKALPCSLSTCDSRQLGLLKAGILGDVLHVEIIGYDEVRNVYTVTASEVHAGCGMNPSPEPRTATPETVAQTPAPGLFSHFAREGKITQQLLNMVLQEEKIHPDSSFVGYAEHVQDPNHFWIRSQKRNEEFEGMMKRLRAHYCQLSLEEDTLSNPEIGTLCGALYMEDRHFYRGVVIDVLEHEAKVLFVDFGNVDRVPHKLIKKMPETLAGIPPFALRCSLSGVFPLEELWTISNSSRFRKLTSNKALEVRVVQIRSNTLVVDLWDGGQRISEMMVSTLDALFRDTPRPHSLSPISLRGWQSSLQQQHAANPDQVSPSKPNTSVSPETFLYSSFDLSPESEEEVYISHLSSQWEVYCQLKRNIGVIEELEQSILEEAMGQGCPDNVVEKLCLAKYQDGNWYRGSVSPVLSPQHLAVFFVDYGNSNIYERRNIKFIRKEAHRLLRVPMQAVRLTLASVPREERHPDVRSWLEQTVLYREVRAVIRGAVERSFNVELFDGDTNINLEVNKLILSLSPMLAVQAHKSLTPKLRAPTLKHVFKKRPADRPRSGPGARAGRGQGSAGRAAARPRDESTKTSGMKRKQQTTETQQPPSVSCERTPRILDRKIDAGRKECFVSHINSVSDFFLQLADDEAAILELYEQLSVSRGTVATASSVKVGDVVLAAYAEDDALYRSVVMAKEGSAAFRVEFVDYGNSAVVEKEKVFTLPTSYTSQPRWSVPCALLDTSVYGSDASFRDAVSGKLLAVSFVQQLQARWEVNVEVISEEEAEPGGEGPAAEVKATVEEVISTPADKEDSTEAEACSDSSAKPSSDGQRCGVETSPVEASAFSWGTQAGDTERGVVLSILESETFFFRLNRSIDWAAHLEKYIAERISTCEPLQDVQEGVKCLVEVGSIWRRAKVLQVNERRCLVLLADQGVTVETPSGSMRKQGSPLVDVPNLAVLCRCGGLRQPENPLELSELVGQEVELTFVSYSEAEKLWLVEMVSSELPLIHQPSDVSSGDGPPQRLSPAPVLLDTPVSCFLSACESPSDFCVVPEASLMMLASVSSVTEGFSGDAPPLPEAHVQPGVLCMFESDSKGKWCRAQIVHVGSRLLLDLVDYGHCESLPYLDFRQLQRLPSRLLDLPRWTYPCTLRGVRPAGRDGEWSQDSVMLFQRLMWGVDLQVLFRESASDAQHLMVDAVVGGVQVAHQLVRAGHAVHVDPLLQLRSGSVLMGPDHKLTLLFSSSTFPPAVQSEEEPTPQDQPENHNCKRRFTRCQRVIRCLGHKMAPFNCIRFLILTRPFQAR
ncbi:tudor domain-containing protein 15 [Neosynchiropus ocellatus]